VLIISRYQTRLQDSDALCWSRKAGLIDREIVIVMVLNEDNWLVRQNDIQIKVFFLR